MPFTYHTHSGQFCCHGQNTLEEMVKAAVSKGFLMMCLTEHMPRSRQYLYPDEIAVSPDMDLRAMFESYMAEAFRLRRVYASQIDVLIGFETEWLSSVADKGLLKSMTSEGFGSLIGPSHHSRGELPRSAAEKYSVQLEAAMCELPKPELFIGSVHHVKDIPIDFDKPTYEKARSHVCGIDGTDEMLFAAYYEHVLELVETLSPPIIGHLDLPRLFSEAKYPRLSSPLLPGFHPLRPMTSSVLVRTALVRVLEAALKLESPAVLEVNSAALRKGLAEPYPCGEILRYWLEQGGEVCLSDDSHCVDHLGTHYPQAIDWLEQQGVHSLVVFKHAPRTRPGGLLDELKTTPVEEIDFPLVIRSSVMLDTVRSWMDSH